MGEIWHCTPFVIYYTFLPTPEKIKMVQNQSTCDFKISKKGKSDILTLIIIIH